MQTLKPEVRQRILQAATQEFLEKGYQGASMRGIAQRSGVTTGNIYRYFDHKAQLLDAILLPCWEMVADLIESFARDYTPDLQPEDQLIRTISGVLGSVCRAYRVEFRLLLNCCQGSKYECAREELQRRISQRVLQEMGPGEGNDLLAEMVGLSLVDCLCLILQHCETNMDQAEHLMHRMVKFLLQDFTRRMDLAER